MGKPEALPSMGTKLLTTLKSSACGRQHFLLVQASVPVMTQPGKEDSLASVIHALLSYCLYGTALEGSPETLVKTVQVLMRLQCYDHSIQTCVTFSGSQFEVL